MSDDKNFPVELFEKSFDKVLKVLVAIAIGVVACLVLSSCKTQYIPVPEYHYEHIHSTDTIKQTDSVFNEKETIIRETNKSDSALLASLGIQLAEGQKAILILRRELESIRNEKSEVSHDTIIKVDTIGVPVPVEKKVSVWKKLKYRGQGALFGASAVGVIGVGLWLRRRYRRS